MVTTLRPQSSGMSSKPRQRCTVSAPCRKLVEVVEAVEAEPVSVVSVVVSVVSVVVSMVVPGGFRGCLIAGLRVPCRPPAARIGMEAPGAHLGPRLPVRAARTDRVHAVTPSPARDSSVRPVSGPTTGSACWSASEEGDAEDSFGVEGGVSVSCGVGVDRG
ncbi:hypothetical protein GCM10023220_42360 [Streptomyces ziwulingensis]|uniref:Uncharacterized protein n=1 Tax=Streptomyces ziwulingensis TaxID=1045501 RepID=A0ABP9CEG9_9ACTN